MSHSTSSLSGHYDVLIAGGGVMGSALAYNLVTKDADLKVAVIERDLSYERSSTVRSDGNIRIQFNIKENIWMSQYGLEILHRFPEEMATAEHQPNPGLRKQGNIWLCCKNRWTEVTSRGIMLKRE